MILTPCPICHGNSVPWQEDASSEEPACICWQGRILVESDWIDNELYLDTIGG